MKCPGMLEMVGKIAQDPLSKMYISVDILSWAFTMRNVYL